MSNFDKEKNIHEETDIAITPDEFTVEGQEPNNASGTTDTGVNEIPDVYVLKFSKPKKYNGKEITEITFNWGDLTSADGLAIEEELFARGKLLASPTFSGEFIFRMASRASTPRVGVDFFESAVLSISDYHKIRSAARNFLILSE